MSFPCHVSDTLVINGVYVMKKKKQIRKDLYWKTMNFLSIFLTMRENIEIFFAIQQRHATTKKVFFTKSRHPQSGCFYYNIYTHTLHIALH